MNPNAIVLTPEQLAALKAEIVEEVRREVSTKHSPYALTSEIKQLTYPIFGQDYQIVTAISTIARKTFNVRHQTFFHGDRLNTATNMVKELVGVIEKYRKGGNE